MLPAYAGMIQDGGGKDVQVDAVLPAYAGMILRTPRPSFHTGRAPRVCGDDPVFFWRVRHGLSCSPRMRG